MGEFIIECNDTGAGMCFIDRLIRCKDCKYLQLEDMGMYATCVRGRLGMVRPNDYCSRAERRDTADDTAPTGPQA